MNTPNIQTQRNRIITLAVGLAIAIGAIVGGQLATADSGRSAQPKPTIVLVHGAWADGSSWNEVTERLQRSGYEVRVPPNNLRSVATDAADLANYLGTIEGPVVLVGHSYGGMVITNAAVNAANVEALVYVNALIPNEGDTLVGMTHPPSIFAQDPANVLNFVPYTNAPPEAVDTYVKPSVYGDAFANRDFSPRAIEALAANQRPLSTQVFNEPSGPPAWATIPSWAVVGKYDQIIPIADQTSMAENAGARVVTVNAPHLSMLTHDRDVADVIITAAKSL